MPNEIAKVVIKWTGFSGAPGFTNLFFNDFTEGSITQAIVDGSMNRTDALVSAWQSRVPSTVTLQVDSTVQIIDVATGQITRFMQGAVKTQKVGTGSGAYSAAAGACINWRTNGVRKGRRVRGRSFVVPLAGSALDATGTIADTQLTGLRTAANALFATGADQGLPGVYARPSTPGASDGAWFPIVAADIPDKTAVLRSRRD